jgi:hypothetical protein
METGRNLKIVCPLGLTYGIFCSLIIESMDAHLRFYFAFYVLMRVEHAHAASVARIAN